MADLTPSLSDLKFAYYGGGNDAEMAFLMECYAQGITAYDLIALVDGGGGAAAAPLNLNRAAGTDVIISGKRTADTEARWQITADGRLLFDDGNDSSPDKWIIDPGVSTPGTFSINAWGSASERPMWSFGGSGGSDSAGNLIAYVSSSGVLQLVPSANSLQPHLFTAGGGWTGGYQFPASSAASRALSVKGFASQTAMLQEWMNSAGTVMAGITAAGKLSLDSGAGGIYGGSGNVYLTDFNSTHMNIVRCGGDLRVENAGGAYINAKFNTSNAAAGVTLILKNAGSQTGDSQQWVNQADAVLASVTAAGLHRWNTAGNQQTTVGAAGGATALPATPTKYLKVVDSAGTTLVIPAYAAA